MATLDLGDFKSDVTRNMQTSGKPLDVPLADIAENPDNPRTQFDDEYLAELAADITANGVKSPVSIQPNPDGSTKWVLNYGACRYRASQIAGNETIPAFIDEQFTDYDAVAENEQRRNLTAMELALFVKKRLGQGDKQKTIAERLHVAPEAITHHKAMLNMPESVDAAYRSGQVSSAKVIYELVKLHKQHATDVAAWLADQDSITWAGVQKLIKALKTPTSKPDTAQDAPKSKSCADTPQNDKTADNAIESPDVARFVELPEFLVTIGKRSAVIDMIRKPTARGMVWVRYLDDDSTAEVKAGSCTLIELAVAADLRTNRVGA